MGLLVELVIFVHPSEFWCYYPYQCINTPSSSVSLSWSARTSFFLIICIFTTLNFFFIEVEHTPTNANCQIVLSTTHTVLEQARHSSKLPNDVIKIIVTRSFTPPVTSLWSWMCLKNSLHQGSFSLFLCCSTSAINIYISKWLMPFYLLSICYFGDSPLVVSHRRRLFLLRVWDLDSLHEFTADFPYSLLDQVVILISKHCQFLLLLTGRHMSQTYSAWKGKASRCGYLLDLIYIHHASLLKWGFWVTYYWWLEYETFLSQTLTRG
jgi:hypothetical protein